MSLLDAALTAVRAIAANRLRSALTALGLIIGVSSVIVLVAVGQGTQKGVTDRIRGLGTDLIFVEPEGATGGATGPGGGGSSLFMSDAEGIASARIPGVAAVASQVRLTAQAIAAPEDVAVEIVATTSDYGEVRDATLSSGSFLPPETGRGGALTAVLGARVARDLFGAQDPTGRDVRLSFAGGRITISFTVIGVLAEQGGSGEADGQVFVPLSALQSRFRFLSSPTGDIPVSQIDIRTLPGTDQERVKRQVGELLLFLHETPEPDFRVQSQDDLIDAATAVSNTLSMLLGSVAGISLLVGGIGVMNIMLVSVTERIREIGIRRAVGATGRDIVMQFVAEALILSLAGGLAGVLLGVAVSMQLDGRELGGQEMITVIQPWSIVLAFAVAAFVGFASGSYPAYRATAVDPITALRNE